MRRIFFLSLGLLCVALGVIGAFLPLLPTVPFLLLALWCFARSSQRFHDWLYHHPRFGPPLQRWQKYGVIPTRVKAVACATMAASFSIVLLTTDHPYWIYAAIAAALLCIGGWIATRPSQIPREDAFQTGENSP